MRELDMSAHMVGGQWGLALLRENCMEFMDNPPCTVPIMALLGVMNDLWIIVHGSIIHQKQASIQAFSSIF